MSIEEYEDACELVGIVIAGLFWLKHSLKIVDDDDYLSNLSGYLEQVDEILEHNLLIKHIGDN